MSFTDNQYFNCFVYRKSAEAIKNGKEKCHNFFYMLSIDFVLSQKSQVFANRRSAKTAECAIWGEIHTNVPAHLCTADGSAQAVSQLLVYFQ